jgi:fibronectin type 3 domain-containing protein
MVVGVGLVPVAEPASAAEPVTTMTAEQLNSAFNTYGDAGGHWTGGDGTTSVALPDGRVVWLFSDTFLGTVNADGSRPSGTPLINNSAVVQTGTTLGATLHGGTAALPQALVVPSQSGEYFWVADGLVESGELKVIYNRYRRTGLEPLDFTLTGGALATFALPSLTLSSVVDLPVGSEISWGSAIMPDGDHTYVYGTSSAPGRMKFGHVARAPAGELDGPWQFWTGSGWSAEPGAATRLLSGVGTSYSVQKMGSEYVLVTHENNLIFDPQIVAYTSPSPTGPFTGPTHLYTAPEPTPGSSKIIYDVRLHPELATPGNLLLSYNVNSLEYEDNLADARLYRPRFLDIAWPLPAPGTGLPAAPTGLTVTGQDDYADLSWSAVSGASGYHVHRRDVTGGQTHFARQPEAVAGTSSRAGWLIPGHRYEFAVTAVSGAGEGPASATVPVVPQSTTPVSEAVESANLPESVPGSYIVLLKSNAAQPERVASYAGQLVAQAGGTLGPVLPRTLQGFGATLTEAQAVNLAAHPDVLVVQQNAVHELAGEQADPPWHLDRIDQPDLPLDQMYRYPNDGAVHAYVVDTGVRATHSQFGGRVTAGFNVFDGSTNTPDCGDAHGTPVAALIGGSSFGVAKNVQIVPVKVFECTPTGPPRGTSLDVAKGIEWAVTDAGGKAPAVMNISITIVQRNTAVNKAVLAAVDSGMTVVTAAGNAAADSCTFSPAALSASSPVITVGASQPDDQVAPFSNQGSCVTLFAPGSAISSAGSGSDTGVVIDRTGTSFAAPLVAGAAAMVLEAHPDYGPGEVKEALVAAATRDKLSSVGTGAPNLLLYVERPPTTAPTNLTATPRDDGTIDLDWDPAAGQNLHYLVSSRDVTAGETEFRRWPSPVFNATSARAEDLWEGHLYEFRVAAANTAGTGPESNIAGAVSHMAPPPAPAGLTATALSDGTIRLTWDSLGSDIWYWVYQRDVTAGETEPTRLPLPVTSCCAFTAGYLLHGHEYEFTIAGINRGGEGPASAPASATSTYPRPGPPSNLTAAAASGQVTLTWTPSPTPHTWYLIHQRDVTLGETEFTTLPLPITSCCTMTAGFLTNGHTYEFTVTATAQGGESLPTNVVSAVPQVPLPGQVTGLTATTQSDGSIRLDWTAPGEDLWFELQMRDVTAGESGFTKLPYPVTTCCTFAVSLLTHNHVYEFKVGAINAAGTGPLSPAARATAVYSAPDAPPNLRGVAAGDGTIDLDWDAPGTTGYYYWIYQRDVTAGESFAKLGLPTLNTHASLGWLVHGHVYEFKVTAENQGGEGPASNTVQVTAKGGLPQPPTNLTAAAGDGEVALRWTASSTPDVLYVVYQRDKTANQSWTRLPLPLSGTQMTAGFLTNGHTYEFKVTASNVAGESGPSNIASAKPMPPLPQPPSGLAAAAGDGKVTLTWSASPTPNVWYWIEYRRSGGSWQRLPYPVTTCCGFTVSYLWNGTTYDFRVRATNLAGDSSASNVASAKPMPPFPERPGFLRGSIDQSRIRLSWTASPTSNVMYRVYMRDVSRGTGWVTAGRYLTSTQHDVPLAYLNRGDRYEFKVTAENLAGESPASNTWDTRVQYIEAHLVCIDLYFDIVGYPAAGWSILYSSTDGAGALDGWDVDVRYVLMVNGDPTRTMTREMTAKTSSSTGKFATPLRENTAVAPVTRPYDTIEMFATLYGPSGQKWATGYDSCWITRYF